MRRFIRAVRSSRVAGYPVGCPLPGARLLMGLERRLPGLWAGRQAVSALQLLAVALLVTGAEVAYHMLSRQTTGSATPGQARQRPPGWLCSPLAPSNMHKSPSLKSRLRRARYNSRLQEPLRRLMALTLLAGKTPLLVCDLSGKHLGPFSAVL